MAEAEVLTPGNDTLIRCEGLKVDFRMSEGIVHAVDGVDFEIKRGRTLGVVGESGCGKSVTAQSILRIIPKPGRITGGKITYYRRRAASSASKLTADVVLTDLKPDGPEIREIRGGQIAMIFQEPLTSLSPVHTVGNQIMEAIMLHQDMDKKDARDSAIEMLSRVGMPNPVQIVDNYPHQLSGGMRQRAMIAMALSCHPSLLMADEPTSALDVTTQAQIADLMNQLQQELGMSILYITHDLGVVAEMADDVIVMYLGRVVECSDVDSLFHDPQHPYTQALLRSIPRVDQDSEGPLESIHGMVPDPYSLPQGCAFHPRCRACVTGLCDTEEPPVVPLGNGRWVRCHLHRQNGS